MWKFKFLEGIRTFAGFLGVLFRCFEDLVEEFFYLVRSRYGENFVSV